MMALVPKTKSPFQTGSKESCERFGAVAVSVVIGIIH